MKKEAKAAPNPDMIPRKPLTDKEVLAIIRGTRNPLPKFAVGPRPVQEVIASLLNKAVNHPAVGADPWRDFLFRPRQKN